MRRPRQAAGAGPPPAWTELAVCVINTCAVVVGGRWTPETTLALANAVGAATATGRGAGRNVARRDTVLHLLEQGAGAGTLYSAHFARARELLLAQAAQSATAA